jgi:hypothetical protein
MSAEQVNLIPPACGTDARFAANVVRARRAADSPHIVWVVLLLWGVVIAAGVLYLMNYAYTPGPQLGAAAIWPDDASLPRAEGRPTLVMFVHPRCPCSGASIEELHRLVVNSHESAVTLVVFVRPPGVDVGWEHARLWDQAASIPGVQLHVDSLGVDARRFGATTSGQTYLYDAAGHLLFRGGITSSRGHVGESLGRLALEQVFHGESPTCTSSSVYGCPLFGPNSHASNKEETPP